MASEKESVTEICAYEDCERDVSETERCYWHREEDGKVPLSDDSPVEEIPDDLRGAHLRDADLAGELFVSEGVNFTDANLLLVDFTGANLQLADFTDALLAGVDFTDASLKGADFTDASLHGADFVSADLFNADFIDASLQGTDLTDANLQYANLSDSNLQFAQITGVSANQANMSGVDARDATFDTSSRQLPLGNHSDSRPSRNNTPRYTVDRDAVERGLVTAHDVSPAEPYADLEDAILEEADLRGATFRNARLYQTDLTNARINAETTFDAETGTTVYERDRTLDGWFTETTDTNAEAGAWVHRRLERLHEDNALSERAREFHIRKQEAERKHHRWSASRSLVGDDFRHWARWTALILSGGLTRHGESLQRVVAWSVGVIGVAAFLFPLVGGFYSRPRDRLFQLEPGGLHGPSELLTTYVQSLYFSVITFSTIGYGDLSPRGLGSQILVGIESLAGAVLIALFIFVLGRRTAR